MVEDWWIGGGTKKKKIIPAPVGEGTWFLGEGPEDGGLGHGAQNGELLGWDILKTSCPDSHFVTGQFHPRYSRCLNCYPLVNIQKTIENDPSIVDLPIKNAGSLP